MTYTPTCRARHCTEYAIRPAWLMEALSAIRAGAYPERPAPVAAAPSPGLAVPENVPLYVENGIGIIQITGPMMKGWSKFADADTLAIRQAVRMARSSPDVRGIMLLVDSPGGSVAGVQALADEVAAAAKDKPLHAYVDDLGASAAYWVSAQAGRIAANRTALVGSIGVFTTIEDTSAMAEGLGVKVHVIQSGPLKAGTVDGVPVSEEVIADTQRIVDSMFAEFQGAVSKGRGLKGKRLDSVSTGTVWMATEAHDLGLIDAVESFESALAVLAKESRSRPAPRRSAAAAAVEVAKRR